MKTLIKVIFNPEKVIKSEELKNLKGGFRVDNATCYCKDSSGTIHLQETMGDCNCEKGTRWVTSSCWAEHWAYSYCDCSPCT